MIRYINMVILLLACCSLTHASDFVSAGYGHIDNGHDPTEIILTTPADIPVGITRIEVQVVPVVVTYQRISQHFIYGHEANISTENNQYTYIKYSYRINLSLPPQDMSYPFSWFW